MGSANECIMHVDVFNWINSIVMQLCVDALVEPPTMLPLLANEPTSPLASSRALSAFGWLAASSRLAIINDTAQSFISNAFACLHFSFTLPPSWLSLSLIACCSAFCIIWVLVAFCVNFFSLSPIFCYSKGSVPKPQSCTDLVNP